MEFLAVLCVVGFAFWAWQSFGDESAATGDEGAGDEGSEGGGDEGGSEASSETESSKFIEALKGAKMDNWAEVVGRWDEKLRKAGALETQLTEAQQKLADLEGKVSSKSQTETRRAELTKQAISQKFTRSQVNEYLEDHTLDQLDERLAKDREGGDEEEDTGDKMPAWARKLAKQVESLTKKGATQEQNAELQRQLGESLGKHAEGMTDEQKAMIAGFLEQSIETARASGQKLPNVDESVKNLAARFKAIAESAVAKFKEDNKGTAAAGTAEVPNQDYEEQVSSLESDEQQMLKAFRDA